MKRRKIRQADQRNIQGCIDQLQALVDGLKAGTIGLEENDGQAVLLRPGGIVHFDLRVDQAERKETLRVEMSWQPETGQPGQSVVPRPALRSLERVSTQPVELETPARSHEGIQVETEGPPAARSRDRLVAGEFAELYAAARIVGNDGQWHIDQDRLIESLAEAGVDALTQQELYSAALQADADGPTSMLNERVIEALERVTRREALSAARG